MVEVIGHKFCRLMIGALKCALSHKRIIMRYILGASTRRAVCPHLPRVVYNRSTLLSHPEIGLLSARATLHPGSPPLVASPLSLPWSRGKIKRRPEYDGVPANKMMGAQKEVSSAEPGEIGTKVSTGAGATRSGMELIRRDLCEVLLRL